MPRCDRLSQCSTCGCEKPSPSRCGPHWPDRVGGHRPAGCWRRAAAGSARKRVVGADHATRCDGGPRDISTSRRSFSSSAQVPSVINARALENARPRHARDGRWRSDRRVRGAGGADDRRHRARALTATSCFQACTPTRRAWVMVRRRLCTSRTPARRSPPSPASRPTRELTTQLASDLTPPSSAPTLGPNVARSRVFKFHPQPARDTPLRARWNDALKGKVKEAPRSRRSLLGACSARACRRASSSTMSAARAARRPHARTAIVLKDLRAPSPLLVRVPTALALRALAKRRRATGCAAHGRRRTTRRGCSPRTRRPRRHDVERLETTGARPCGPWVYFLLFVVARTLLAPRAAGIGGVCAALRLPRVVFEPAAPGASTQHEELRSRRRRS